MIYSNLFLISFFSQTRSRKVNWTRLIYVVQKAGWHEIFTRSHLFPPPVLKNIPQPDPHLVLPSRSFFAPWTPLDLQCWLSIVIPTNNTRNDSEEWIIYAARNTQYFSLYAPLFPPVVSLTGRFLSKSFSWQYIINTKVVAVFMRVCSLSLYLK